MNDKVNNVTVNVTVACYTVNVNIIYMGSAQTTNRNRNSKPIKRSGHKAMGTKAQERHVCPAAVFHFLSKV